MYLPWLSRIRVSLCKSHLLSWFLYVNTKFLECPLINAFETEEIAFWKTENDERKIIISLGRVDSLAFFSINYFILNLFGYFIVLIIPSLLFALNIKQRLLLSVVKNVFIRIFNYALFISMSVYIRRKLFPVFSIMLMYKKKIISFIWMHFNVEIVHYFLHIWDSSTSQLHCLLLK